MQSYTLALALGLLLTGGWENARSDAVTATVTNDDNRALATSHDWQAHATFTGAGRIINVVSHDRYSTEHECEKFLRDPEVRAAMLLLLGEMKDIDMESYMIAECVQLTIPG